MHTLLPEVYVRSLLADIRYALRLLAKNPAFTGICVLTLALGIGANTAIFSVVNAVLLKPLSYPAPDRLFSLKGSHSLPDVLDVAREAKSVQALGNFADWNLDLIQGAEPERVDAAIVGGDLFPALGVQPVLGRYFSANDDAARQPVVVLSYAFWQRHLGARRDVIGSTLLLSGTSYTVIGVMPSTFKLPAGKSQVWVPFQTGYPEAANARGAHFTYPVGRLRDGATQEQARREIAAIARRLGEVHPEEAREIVLIDLHERIAAQLKTPVLILLAAVALVLLIACANYANLLLASVARRTHEMAVRSALGATRIRLVRQLVTESLVLSLLGGICGVLLASWGVDLLLHMKPEELELFGNVTVDRTTLSFALLASIATGLFFGLAPITQIWSVKAELRSVEASVTPRSRLRRALVVAELAVSIVLLVGAGLLIRSLMHVMRQDAGFETARVLTMRFSLPATRYAEIPTQQAFLSRLDRAVKDVPGVESAGLVTELPLSGSRMQHNMVIAGRTNVKPGEEPEIETHEVTPDCLKTVGIRLLQGRAFDANDRSDSPLVGVINDTMARQYWPGESPIGKQVRWARMPEPRWITITGVVADSRDQSLEEAPQATLYTPMTQKLQPWKRFGAIVVRTRSENPLALADAIRRQVWSVDSQLPVTHVETLDSVVAESVAERRFHTVLLGSFAALALILSVVGLYGVMSYMVTQRTREVGIRIALGASTANIVREFVWSALGMIMIGTALGVACALATTRLMATMLYEVRPTDALTLAGVVLLLSATALLASFVPARRGARVDPMIALRHE